MKTEIEVLRDRLDETSERLVKILIAYNQIKPHKYLTTLEGVSLEHLAKNDAVLGTEYENEARGSMTIADNDHELAEEFRRNLELKMKDIGL